MSQNSKGIDIDLNAEDVTSSINLGAAQSCKEHHQFKSEDVSESASCTGPLREKDHMREWRELKRNGFLSSSHGGTPVPNNRGRESKNDILKENFELAKKEQVDRFLKIAPPSGLLSELNPGIIKHVRNKKQVHSFIEALVSEKNESANAGRKQAAQFSGVSTEVNKRDLEYITESGKASSTKASVSSGSQSNEESSNFPTSLSLKAATFASQWLEFLHQDLKRRLSALRCSRRRVRAVINTELPYLVSKEFSNVQEMDSSVMNTTTGTPHSIIAEMHRTRWTSLFDQMDKTLAEQEKQLVSTQKIDNISFYWSPS